MPPNPRGLFGVDILTQAFSTLLVAGFQARLVGLPVLARAEIADDSEGSGGSHTGYMGYAQATIVAGYEGARYVLACGRKSGQYPGEFYRADIAAVPLRDFSPDDAISPAHLGGALTHNEYFKHSLIVACKDGSLRCPREGTFALRANAMITAHLADFRVTDAVPDRKHIDPTTMQPRIAVGVTYHPDTIAFLASAIHTILMHPIDFGASSSL